MSPSFDRACGCATSSSVQRYSEAPSHFRDPPKLISHTYPPSDVFRLYQQGATGFVSIQSLRENLEERARSFADQQGKSFVVLGEQISQPPYILGNFPRIEIVFALVAKQESAAAPHDKYSDIERLKKLLDSGAITQAEFDAEKAKILR